MTIKEKADALVEKHQNATSLGLSKIGSAKHCILSVEHTIEVLEETKSIIDEIGRPLEIQLMIEQEQLLLTELKSRL